MDQALLQQLRRPEAYAGVPEEVTLIQTHLSVVCLAGDRVYKLKKPVRLPFADFRECERREFFCHEEVRLNRRLCPDVYLGVVPLRRCPGGGSCRFGGGEGEVIDHAVEMRRLPADGMLDVLLRDGEGNGVTPEAIGRIARRMAAFHTEAERGNEVVRLGSPQRLRQFAMENFSETRGMVGRVFDERLHGLLEERTAADFARAMPVLEERAAAGRVLDGHGDLHARNICLEDGRPMIYDCIEFAPALRCGDVATENAFLVMDLRHRGHPELAEAYVNAYEEASGDTGIREHLPMLVRYRAMVRAKVAAFAAEDEDIEPEDRSGALDSARAHLLLAAGDAVRESVPRLALVACGLPASGKSTVLGHLARAANGAVVSTDRVRKELAGVAPHERAPEDAYRPAFSDRTYAEVLDRAVAALGGNGPVMVDGNFATRARRNEAVARLEAAGADVRLVFLDLPDEVAEARLEARETEGGGISDAGIEVFRSLRPQFEAPVSAGEAAPVIRLAAERPVHELAASVMASLLEGVSIYSATPRRSENGMG